MLKLNSKFLKVISGFVGSLLAITLVAEVSPAEAAYAPPIMATIYPNSGTVTGGDFVTITGQNLNRVSDIQVGGSNVLRADIERSNVGEWITFRTPYSSKIGPADVTFFSDVNVTEPGFFTYTASGITSVSPNSGTFRGGTPVTIKGTGFGPMEWGDASLLVKFNGVAATGVKRVSPTQISAVTPAGTKGDATVEVSFTYDFRRVGNFSANVISLAKAYTYTPEVLAPKIDAISPDKGPIAGGTQVTVTGRYLNGSDNLPAKFSFGGLPATNVVVSPDGLTATMLTPAKPAGPVDVLVKNFDSSTTVNSGFTYANAPTITSVTASDGVLEGGTKITITGTNFGSAGMPLVQIGDKPGLCVKLVSPTQVTAVTKEGVAGNVDVSITAPTGGGTATKTGAYTYKAATEFPTISSITPDSGPVAGANSVDIKTTGVFPAGTPNVMFGSACALSVTRVDDKTIRATVPSNAPGAKNVSLTFANGYALVGSGYTYFIPAPPEVTSVTPAVDWTAGGTSVVITGLGFGATGTPVVKFGTVAATNVVRVSDTQITATVPANTAGTKDVTVTPLGSSAITKTGAFKYKDPIISSVKPNSGLFSGGTNVVIYGDGFGTSGVPTVKFNGKTATNIVRLNPTTISATTPAGTKGFATIEITPVGGTVITNATVFAYFELQVAPQIDASSVVWLAAAGGTPVTVTGSNFIGTDGKPGKVYVNGALVSATVASDGKSVTFTSPALSPTNGAYEFKIITNEGTAWKAIFRVAGAPAPSDGSCEFQTSYGRNLDNFGSRTLKVGNGALLLGELGNPTVKLNGIDAPVTAAGNTGGGSPRDYVTFTVPQGIELGPVTTVVTLGQNAGSISNDCFYRRAPLSISADDKTIMYGQDPGAFTKSVSGERNLDKVTSVAFTFTGIDGSSYGPSNIVPTAAGRYQIRPNNPQMSPGNLANYDVYLNDGLFVIQGVPVTIEAIQCTAKIYGDANPAISYRQTGLPAGETIVAGSIKYIFEGYSLGGAHYGPTQTWPTHAGTYTITPDAGTLASGNTASISFTYVPCSYSIAKRPVSISALDTTKIYGSADPARNWTFTNPSDKNLAPGDTTLVGSTSVDRYPGENVGVYDYLRSDIDNANPDYEITYAYWGTLTITKKHISVTGVNSSKNYCQADPQFNYTSAGLIGSDRLSGSLDRISGGVIGDYAYTNGTLSGGNNYIIDSISGGKLTISACPIDVWAYDESKIYGEVDPTLDYEVYGQYGLINGDSLSGSLTRANGSNVGRYTIGRGSLSSSNNYTITFHSAIMEIYKRPLCIQSEDKSKTYGDADPAFTKTVITNYECYSLVGSDAISGSLSRDQGQNVGVYNITTGTLSAGSNYSVTIYNGSLTITKRAITVAPAAKSKTYGDFDPALTFSVTSGTLAYSDVLSGTISRQDGENAGTYPYTLGWFGYLNPNYDVTVDNTAVFTINKKHITVTGIDTQKEYGSSDPGFRYSSSGLVGGDTLSGAMGRDTGENVGNFNYTQGTLSGGNNYIIDSISGGKLVIVKRRIYVCADYQNITYGDPDPSLTYFICGDNDLVNGDSFTGSLVRVNGSNVGAYKINQGTLALSNNYTLIYDYDFLEIDPKTIYIVSDDKTKVYGDSDPTLTYQLAAGYAWVGGDSPTVNLRRASGENVGQYGIEISSVTGGSNYDVHINSSALTITVRDITIRPNAKSKVYGDYDPDFTSFGPSDYTVTVGTLKSGDSLVLAIGRDAGENIGQYNYTIGDLNSRNPNYNITVDTSNAFSITARPITVKALAATKQYGEADPVFEYTVSMTTLPNGTRVQLNGDLTRVAGEGVNAEGYGILQGYVTQNYNNNYIITYVSAPLQITKRDLTLCAEDKESRYGNSVPANSFVVCGGGTAFTDVVGSVSFGYSRPNPVNAGNYNILPSAAVMSSGSVDNYNITYEPGNLRITPREITVLADDKTKVYGASDPVFTYSISAGTLVGSDSFSGLLGRDSGENVGQYSIRLGGLTLGDNYILSVSGGKLEITKRAVKVTPKPNQKKTYGDLDPVYTFDTDITLPFGESLVGALDRTSGENVGDYTYNLGSLATSNPNYEVSLDSSNKFKIEKFVVTITVNNLEKFYGDSDPTYTYTFTPAVLGNGTVVTVSGNPTRAAGENVGEYLISVGTLDAGSNFTATITAGSKLTIKKRPVKLKANDKTSVYGQSLPANSVSIVDGNMIGSETVSGATYGYTTSPAVHVGSYTITPSVATVSGGLASNYEFSYETGTLTITKATLTITLSNSTSDWGDPVKPAGIKTAVGLKVGDKVGDIDYTYDASSTPPALPGSYALDGTVLTFSAGSMDDYDIKVIPATYVINAPFFVGIDPKRGPEAGGTRFIISGFGFGLNNPVVLFDGIEATDVVLIGSNQITGLTPAHVKGLVGVTLITDAGTLELGNVFTYFPPVPTPQIFTLTPAKGPTDGGTKVTITGAAFIGSDKKPAQVFISGVLVKDITVSKDGKTITLVMPPHKVGFVNVDVKTVDGRFSFPSGFEYIQSPIRKVTVSEVIIFNGDSSFLLDTAKQTLDKLIKSIPKNATINSVEIHGWVKETSSTAIDARLSQSRARVTAGYLKSKGITGEYSLAGKGIYITGTAQDRRAEITIEYQVANG